MSDPLMILLQSMDNKIDALSADVVSLKETRAENKGVVRAAVSYSMALAGAIAWLVGLIRH